MGVSVLAVTVVAVVITLLGIGFALAVASSRLDLERLARVAHIYRHYLAPKVLGGGACCDDPPDQLARGSTIRDMPSTYTDVEPRSKHADVTRLAIRSHH